MVAIDDEFITALVVLLFVVCAKDTAAQSNTRPSTRAPVMVLNRYFI